MKIYKQITLEMIQKDIRYLELLSHSFPTIASASTEIINLEAIMNLPKGTEHFLADLHGEYEAFQHVLRNASGAIKRKVNEIFGNTLRESEKKEICTLIYYPERCRNRYCRLVCYYVKSAGKNLPECVIQVYTFQST